MMLHQKAKILIKERTKSSWGERFYPTTEKECFFILGGIEDNSTPWLQMGCGYLPVSPYLLSKWRMATTWNCGEDNGMPRFAVDYWQYKPTGFDCLSKFHWNATIESVKKFKIQASVQEGAQRTSWRNFALHMISKYVVRPIKQLP